MCEAGFGKKGLNSTVLLGIFKETEQSNAEIVGVYDELLRIV